MFAPESDGDERRMRGASTSVRRTKSCERSKGGRTNETRSNEGKKEGERFAGGREEGRSESGVRLPVKGARGAEAPGWGSQLPPHSYTHRDDDDARSLEADLSRPRTLER